MCQLLGGLNSWQVNVVRAVKCRQLCACEHRLRLSKTQGSLQHCCSCCLIRHADLASPGNSINPPCTPFVR